MVNPPWDAWVAVYGPGAPWSFDDREFDTPRPVDVAGLPELVASCPDVAEMLDARAAGERVRADLLGREVRRAVCRLYAWSVPTPEAVEAIAGWVADAGLVEVGAGAGFWASCLEAAGVDVLAFDADPPSSSPNGWHADRVWVEVRPGRAEAAGEHPGRVLMVGWPPTEGSGASGVDAYRLAGGRRLVFVGEEQGGATGDAEFWAELNVHWPAVRRLELPQWAYIHDGVWLYERS